ncbi:hypothetical protein HPB47_008322 [Ixodes persulcatus]|uniref:Uncharacterized protein n=1 Tax=Ixodes persulcatus TaxID=34615 RepID=A0AC60P527_IXOPE|nr:hypothetical protein HPB47_008322 [Ixodes persulcatus]
MHRLRCPGASVAAAALTAMGASAALTVSISRLGTVATMSKAWVEYAKRHDLMDKPAARLYASYYVCSDHFTVHDFMDPGRTRLTKTAVPSVRPQEHWQSVICRGLDFLERTLESQRAMPAGSNANPSVFLEIVLTTPTGKRRSDTKAFSMQQANASPYPSPSNITGHPTQQVMNEPTPTRSMGNALQGQPEHFQSSHAVEILRWQASEAKEKRGSEGSSTRNAADPEA